MSRDKQIEEMAKDLLQAYAINKLCTEDVAEHLYNAGYRKSQDVAEEIFAEIEEIAIQRYAELNSDINRTPEHDKSMFLLGEIKMLQNAFDFISELKKKYTEDGK